MELAIHHLTEYLYEPPVSRVALRLRLFPTVTASQQVGAWTVTVNGAPVEPAFANAYGDSEAFAHVPGPVGQIEIVAEGRVTTSEGSGIVAGMRDLVAPPTFLRCTQATRPDERIEAFAREHGKGDSPLEIAHALSHAVGAAIEHIPGSSDAATTAAAALEAGQGVCQDKTHVLIAAARSVGIPARYVAGYINDEASGESALATHAWAELHVEGIGWIGFDPSNETCPTSDHVRLCSGFDARDAAPVRGSVAGVVDEETLRAEVRVTEVAQGQSQQ